MKKLAVGLSGGVDSSAAAHILLEQGYDVMGIILRLKPDNAADADIAKMIIGTLVRQVELDQDENGVHTVRMILPAKV